METSSRYPWGKGRPGRTYDATANDSDKSFTVPEGKVWMLYAIIGHILTTATVGNRSLVASVTDGTNLIWTSAPTANIAASSQGRLDVYSCLPMTTTARQRLSDVASGVTVQLDSSMPNPFILPEGYVVRVHDRLAVDAAADDLIVVLMYVEYDA